MTISIYEIYFLLYQNAQSIFNYDIYSKYIYIYKYYFEFFLNAYMYWFVILLRQYS